MKKTLSIFILTILALVCLSMSYKLILYFSLYDYFGSHVNLLTALWHGLRFDFAIASLVAIFISLVYFLSLVCISNPSIRSYSLLIPVLAVTYFHFYALADLIYYLDSGTHMLDKISNFYYWWEITLAFIAYIIIGGCYIKIFFYISHKMKAITYQSIIKRLFHGTIYSISLFLILAAMQHGGFSGPQLRPAHIFHNLNSYEVDIAMNPNYVMMHHYINDWWHRKKGDVYERNIVTFNKAVHPYIAELYPNNNLAPSTHSIKKVNIVLVLLESWVLPQKNAAEIIPNFLSISRKGIRVKRMLTEALHTTQGLFAVSCSFPNPFSKQPITKQKLVFFNYYCLPAILAENGWQTAMFQGTYTDTVALGPFAEKLGAANSYGKEHMSPELEHNGLGAHDHDIYNFVVETVAEYQEPFMAIINTNTTHDIVMPRIDFGASSILNYADAALGKFISDYKQLDLKQDTLFILVSDHTAGKINREIDRYSVAFTMFGAGINPSYFNDIYQHQDIAPTILDVLGIAKPQHFLGKSILANHHQHHAYYYTYGRLNWVENEILITINVINKHNSMTCYINLLEEIPCKQEHIAMRDRALAFTSYTQKLIYTGKIQKFADIFKK